MNSVTKKPILFFLATRYAGYVLLFLRGLIIAKFLGTFYFGIWGFLTLILQYLSYSSFGINYALTVQLSTGNQTDQSQKSQISSMAILATTLISLVFILISKIALSSGVELFPRYEFSKYMIMILFIAGVSNVQQVIINILRVEKKTFIIALVEIVTSILLLISAFIYRDNRLIDVQLLTMLITGILSLILLAYKYPYKFQFYFKVEILNSLFKLGFPLFIYNLSFYLITISTRTIISAFYPIEILGFFTLANSISYATLLGLQTVGWLIYPEVLSRTTENNSTDDTRQTINRINILYNTACYLMVFVLIIFLPLVLLFIPQYRSALPIITIMVISQAVLSSSYGFNALATSRKKQNVIALIGLGVVLFIICFGISISMLHWNPTWIAILLLIGSFIYTALQVKIGTSILGLNRSGGKKSRTFFPPVLS